VTLGYPHAFVTQPAAEVKGDQRPSQQEFWRALRARHPGLREALTADARVTALHRGERYEFRSRLDAAAQIARLAWVSDAFLAQALYRAKARMQALGVPILPRLAHRLAMALAQISIGDPVVMHPGVYIIHGQFVADGLVEIHSGAVIAPFVTIGLRAGDVTGATIESNVSIGTGAKVIGAVKVGQGAQIGANAVVVNDVAAGTTVVGAPARVTGGTNNHAP
jgi:serine O-acetyltransferase